MPLLQDDPKYGWKRLLLLGLPAFVAAVMISGATHRYAHLFAEGTATQLTAREIVASAGLGDVHTATPAGAVAGPAWTFFLALLSFTLYMRFPRSLFLGAMAFVNASMRLPETVTVFLQLLFTNRTQIVVDESLSLALIRLNDPTLSVILLCFFSLTILFLTVTIVHDTKMVPWKWAVAVTLFFLIAPLQSALWRVL